MVRIRGRLTLTATLVLAIAWFLNRKSYTDLADAALSLAIIILCISLLVKG